MMKTYRVKFEKKAAVWYEGFIEVEARNEKEARQKADVSKILDWEEIDGETEDVSLVEVERID